MDAYEKKTFKTSRSLTYTYYVSDGQATESTPALFFVHGWPDSAHLWRDVVARLSDLPNKILIPDTLGYAGSDKPTDTALYSVKGQADDMAEIIRAERAERTIIIGHDWGSSISQRTYLHHPELFSAVVLLNVAYIPPREEPFELARVNAMTAKIYGNPLFAYWEFFSAEDAAKVTDANLEKMYEVIHGDSENWAVKMFCTPGAVRKYLTGDDRVPLRPYAQDPKWKDAFLEQFRRDGFDGPYRMYKAAVADIHRKSDGSIPKENYKIQVPVLYVGCTGDPVCRHDMIELPKKAGLLPDLEQQSIVSGHWCPMEKPDEVAKHIKNFVTKRFPLKAKA